MPFPFRAPPKFNYQPQRASPSAAIQLALSATMAGQARSRVTILYTGVLKAKLAGQTKAKTLTLAKAALTARGNAALKGRDTFGPIIALTARLRGAFKAHDTLTLTAVLKGRARGALKGRDTLSAKAVLTARVKLMAKGRAFEFNAVMLAGAMHGMAKARSTALVVQMALSGKLRSMLAARASTVTPVRTGSNYLRRLIQTEYYRERRLMAEGKFDRDQLAMYGGMTRQEHIADLERRFQERLIAEDDEEILRMIDP